MNNRGHELFRHFGLNPDALYWGDAHAAYARRIADAIDSRRFTAVIGGFGCGKSELVRESLTRVEHDYDKRGGKKLHQVWINQSDRERIGVGTVVRGMLRILADEQGRTDPLAQQYQLARVLGGLVVKKGGNVVVVIENAHRMNVNTIRDLKDLRESVIFDGRAFLFSLILIGQETLEEKVARFGEVFFRTRVIELDESQGWMTFAERVNYLSHVYRDVIEPGVRERIAAVYRTPLQIDRFVEGKLEMMQHAGFRVLDEQVFPPTLRESMDAAGLSVRAVERLTGISRSSVQDVIAGKSRSPEAISAVQAAIDQARAERHQQVLGRTGS